MRAIRLFVFCFLFLVPLLASAATVTGVVKAPNGQPVDGATVDAGGRTALTDAQGGFTIDVAEGVRTLHVSKSGFQSADIAVGTAEVTLQPALAESIVVSGIRADAATPVTKSDITRTDIERDYTWQDVPLLLRDTPSISTYTESGIGGSGYSYITLRGISPTRLNITLDGVPLADSEDMGVYFDDFPDLAHSLQSIQIQRGVGTSTVGSPSFGGSINLESIALSQTQSLDAEAGGGSFGTKFATVGWQSGMTASGYAMYARLSADQSDGFRESSGVRQHNLFVSAEKQNDTSRLLLTGFSAHERTAQSFLAADSETLKTDLRFNEMSPLEDDSFGYDLAQLQYLKALSPATNMTASVYYQRGYGWYRLFDDETTRDTLRQYGLDGLLIGSMYTLSTNHGPLAASYGLNVNEFRREHTRDVVLGADAGTRDYYNYGTKGEINAFAKYTWNLGRTHLYSDQQVRSTNFHYYGDVSIPPIRWTFYTPKFGARYDLTPASGLYATAGLSHREPTRNDLFEGEDNATIPHDLHAVTPERLLDVEAGYDLRVGTTTFKANLYDMDFHHEISATGELSDIGLPLFRNSDRSYRRGIELEAAWQATKSLRFRGNASVSHNRIRSWTQFFDVYDAAGNLTGSTPVVFRNVKPVLTPQLILNESIDWTPAASRLTLGATGRYVGKSQLDNTNDPTLVTPSFATLEANAAWDLGRGTRVKLQVNNLTDNKRVYASGYSYNFIAAGVVSGTAYYYPQATRNAVVMVDFKR